MSVNSTSVPPQSPEGAGSLIAYESGNALTLNTSYNKPGTFNAVTVANNSIKINDIPIKNIPTTFNSNTSFVVNLYEYEPIWKRGNLPSTSFWSGLAFGNNVFSSTSSNTGNTFAVVSTDGITWTSATMTSGQNWVNSASDGNIFVNICNNSSVYALSTDGVSWQQSVLPVSAEWYGHAWGNGIFVGIAYNSSYLVTSPNGITWTLRNMPVSSGWYIVKYHNNLFVTTSYLASYFATSTNGITWTTSNLPTTTNAWYNNSYGNGRYVVIAAGSSNYAHSTNGITWTGGNLPATTGWQAIEFGNGSFVAISGQGTASSISAYSTDGITWTSINMLDSSQWAQLKYAKGKFVAVSASSASFVAYLQGRLDESIVDKPYGAYTAYGIWTV